MAKLYFAKRLKFVCFEGLRIAAQRSRLILDYDCAACQDGEEMIGHKKKIVGMFGKDVPTIFYKVRFSAFVKPSNDNLVNRIVGRYA